MLPGGGGWRGGGGTAIIGGLDLSTAGVVEVTLDLGVLSSRIDETAESIDCLSD